MCHWHHWSIVSASPAHAPVPETLPSLPQHQPQPHSLLRSELHAACHAHLPRQLAGGAKQRDVQAVWKEEGLQGRGGNEGAAQVGGSTVDWLMNHQV